MPGRKRIDTTPILQDDEQSEEIVDSKGIIPIGREQIIGLRIENDHMNVEVWERNLFKRRTVIEKFGRMKEDKVYERGDYSPWILATRPYHNDLASAFRWIAELMMQKKIAEAGNVDVLANIMEQVFNELPQNVDTVKDKIVAKTMKKVGT